MSNFAIILPQGWPELSFFFFVFFGGGGFFICRGLGDECYMVTKLADFNKLFGICRGLSFTLYKLSTTKYHFFSSFSSRFSLFFLKFSTICLLHSGLLGRVDEGPDYTTA